MKIKKNNAPKLAWELDLRVKKNKYLASAKYPTKAARTNTEQVKLGGRDYCDNWD